MLKIGHKSSGYIYQKMEGDLDLMIIEKYQKGNLGLTGLIKNYFRL